MDPFTGLGSTAVACARLGVNFIGSDIDELYLTEAAERMEAAGKGPCCPAVAWREWRKRSGRRPLLLLRNGGRRGGLRRPQDYSFRENTSSPLRVSFTSSWRRRLVASGSLE